MLQNFKAELKLFLIVAAASAVLAVIGIFLLQNVSNQVTHISPASSPQPQAIDTKDFTLSEVEGWQTYQNDEFGFEVKYPSVCEKYDEERIHSSNPLHASVYPVANEVLLLGFVEESI